MQQTSFHIAKMDCAAEENLIRLRLSGLNIEELRFDLSGRNLHILHREDPALLLEKLSDLGLGAEIIGTRSATDISSTSDHSQERKLLWSVLTINGLFFFVELLTGLISGSMGLLADSLDMMADAIVYGLSLYAVGRALSKKQKVAEISGYFQMALAVLGFAEVVRRFFGHEETPGFQMMILVSALALIANALCLFLLQKSKSREAHMRASVIFTSNDVLANMGVMTAGALVYITHSKYPDLLIGAAVFFFVFRGAIRILKLSK